MRRFLLIAIIALVASACSGSDDADSVTTTQTPEATDTTVTATTIAGGETTTTAAAPSTTEDTATDTTAASTTTSTTTVAPGPGRLALTRVVFAPVVYITITNVGNGPAELSAHWLCQRPAYKKLPSLVLEAGDTVAIGFGEDAPPDLVEFAAVIELGDAIGVISKDGGEIGLYLDPFFENPTAMVDYVEWGSSGHGRSSVAVEAGLWTEGAFVTIPPEASSISSSGASGGGVEDWFADVGG
jgi:hypothetical protein